MAVEDSYKLHVLSGADAGSVINLVGASIKLGGGERTYLNEVDGYLSIKDPSIASVQAVLTWEEAQKAYRISNRSAISPIVVDDKPCAYAMLVDGSTIKVGSSVLQIEAPVAYKGVAKAEISEIKSNKSHESLFLGEAPQPSSQSRSVPAWLRRGKDAPSVPSLSMENVTAEDYVGNQEALGGGPSVNTVSRHDLYAPASRAGRPPGPPPRSKEEIAQAANERAAKELGVDVKVYNEALGLGLDPVVYAKALELGIEPHLFAQAWEAGIDPQVYMQALQLNLNPVAYARALEIGLDPVIYAQAITDGIDPQVTEKAMLEGIRPEVYAQALAQGIKPQVYAEALVIGMEPQIYAQALAQGIEPQIYAQALELGLDPQILLQALAEGLDPQILVQALAEGVDPHVYSQAVAQGIEPKVFAQALSAGIEPQVYAQALAKGADPVAYAQSLAQGGVAGNYPNSGGAPPKEGSGKAEDYVGALQSEYNPFSAYGEAEDAGQAQVMEAGQRGSVSSEDPSQLPFEAQTIITLDQEDVEVDNLVEASASVKPEQTIAFPDDVGYFKPPVRYEVVNAPEDVPHGTRTNDRALGRLLVVRGANHGRSMEVYGSVTIGRSTKNDFVLPDPQVSRRHCSIQFLEDGVYLVNHSTSSTTRIGKQLIKDRGRLEQTSEIILANKVCIYWECYI